MNIEYCMATLDACIIVPVAIGFAGMGTGFGYFVAAACVGTLAMIAWYWNEG